MTNRDELSSSRVDYDEAYSCEESWEDRSEEDGRTSRHAKTGKEQHHDDEVRSLTFSSSSDSEVGGRRSRSQSRDLRGRSRRSDEHEVVNGRTPPSMRSRPRGRRGAGKSRSRRGRQTGNVDGDPMRHPRRRQQEQESDILHEETKEHRRRGTQRPVVDNSRKGSQAWSTQRGRVEQGTSSSATKGGKDER
ncbi:unnamed protein product, partial [Amoebophrya sp. A25]|eukprot:GSA25T00018839001.1